MSSTFVLAICAVLLLLCLVGGVISTALHALEKPGPEASLKDKISFKLWIIGQIIFVVTAIYYHSKGGGAPTPTD
jgi:uncharacterized BrkB/YihY/UPF0761 family membrane protein